MEIVFDQSTQKQVGLTVFSVLLVFGLFTGLWMAVDNWQTDWVEASIVNQSSINSQTIALMESTLSPDLSLASGAIGGGDSCLTFDGLSLESCNYYGQDSVDIVNTQESIYVVRAGDTISEIAETFRVTPDTIIWANDLGKYIHEGQHLVILPFSGIRHQVKKGDTLSKIAELYKADLEEITLYNDITDDMLVVGDFIDVIGGKKPAPITPPSTTRVAERSSSNSLPTISGYFMRPIRGGIRTQGLHFNNAVDLAAPYGTAIYAAAGGVVKKSIMGGWNGGYGNYIMITHPNGTETLYSHNSQNIVAAGQQVAQGQVIGYIGSTGRSTGPHVHFEIRGAANPF